MTTNIHATTVLIAAAGVLIRGPSGSGKSALARQLLDAAAAQDIFAALVADDRTDVSARNQRLIASCPAQLEGLMDVRFYGLARVIWQKAAVIRLVVDLVDAADRYPEESERRVELEGVRLAAIKLPAGTMEANQIVFRCLNATTDRC
jgi:serine kinase of HPr protein (carbohydrate metabolism regulator)